LVDIDMATASEVIGGLGLYARVFCRDQRADLGGQVGWLSGWAAKAGHRVVGVEAEIGSGVNGGRSKAERMLAGPAVASVVVERKGPPRPNERGAGWSRFVRAHCPRMAVVLWSAMTARLNRGLVGDVVGVLTSLCARLYGRCSAKNRACKALGAAGDG
jgi:putative resolvase